MLLAVAGLSHSSAPVALRERLSYTGESRAAALAELRTFCAEAVILDTCNRSELYVAFHGGAAIAAAVSPEPGAGAVPSGADEARAISSCLPADALAGFLARFHRVPRAELQPHLYVHLNAAAAAHLCTVAAGADSQVIGEAQVLAQVREAFEFACAQETCGPVLSALFRQGLRAGKRARAETRIGQGSLSLGSLAVEHALNLCGPLATQKILLLGAGRMNTLVARSLRAAGAEHLAIANRTLAHAAAMAAEFGGSVLPWEAVADALTGVDLVFTATSAPQFVLPLEMLAQASASRSTPLCIVDLALPRDADPLAAGLPNVNLVGLDDLRALAEHNLAQRRAELERVQAIVAAEAADYERWLSTRAVAPAITALHQRAEEIRQSELADHLRRLPDLSPREKRVIESMTASMMGRMLREPTLRLKFHAQHGEGKPYADALRELFGLEEYYAD